MARRIMPPQEYLRECFSYDAEAGILRWLVRPAHHFPAGTRWKAFNATYAGKVAGSPCGGPPLRIRVNLSGNRFWAYRLIWKMVTGEEPDEMDHINGDPTDNRFSNLRATTHTGNMQNMPGWSQRGHTPKGVVKRPHGYTAAIMAAGVRYHLGSFATSEEAHAAYCEAAVRLHGDFANFGHTKGA